MRPQKRLIKLINAFIITFLLVSNSWAGSDEMTINTARLHSMIVDNAYKLEAGREKQFMVIDARTKEEYDATHIFSAISIPEKDFEKSANLLPRDKGVLIVVYDNQINSGTSVQWVVKATNAGYTNIVIYSEGFPVWKQKHMPIAPL